MTTLVFMLLSIGLFGPMIDATIISDGRGNNNEPIWEIIPSEGPSAEVHSNPSILNTGLADTAWPMF